MTLTETLLLIGFLIASYIAYRALGKSAKWKENYDLVVGHNKTLAKLYQDNHLSAMTLLETLNKNFDYQRDLERRNYDLTVDNLKLTHKP